MYIHFYKVTDQARQDFGEINPSLIYQIRKQSKSDDEFLQELNRIMRKYANLGIAIEERNGFIVKQYYDLLFVIKDYTVQYVYKSYSNTIPISNKDEEKYDYIERKLTNKIVEC